MKTRNTAEAKIFVGACIFACAIFVGTQIVRPKIIFAIDLSEVHAMEAAAQAKLEAEAREKQEAEARERAEAEAEAVRQEIAAKNAELQKIENEIDMYQKWLNSAQDQSKTLSGVIQTLDVERKKMNAGIQKTQNQIRSASLTVNELEDTIIETEKKIQGDKVAIQEIIRATDRADSRSLVEAVLSQNKFSDMLDEAAELSYLRGKISDRMVELRSDKEKLLGQKTKKESETKKLFNYKDSLEDQKTILDEAKKEKNSVLLATKNREATYQKILDENFAKQKALQHDLAIYESTITKTLKAPPPEHGMLLWPVDLPYVTQTFGVTKDSVRLYASGSHNGIDLRASVGTALVSPGPGVVVDVGDTDKSCPKASYGKWVLIRHTNGLTTLMAHFSLIKVIKGQSLTAGQLVGYSGNTGYSTGPHLHVTVFSSDGVNVGSISSKACSGKSLTMPLPTANPPYLNPLGYFPAI